MYLRYILIVFIFFASFVCVNAEPLTSYEVDVNSYRMYMNQQYDSLHKHTRVALKQHIDFYYLRVRNGLAYFFEKKYTKAIVHFNKALDFYPTDAISLTYLYYSYLYTGKNAEALLVLNKLPASQKNEIGHKKNKLLEFVNIESGPLLSTNASNTKSLDIDGSNNIYGSYNQNNNMYYTQLGVKSFFLNRLHIYNSGSLLTIQKTNFIKYNNNEKSAQNDVKQLEYYIGTDYLLNTNWSLTGAYHLVNVSYTTLTPTYNTTTNAYSFSNVDTKSISHLGLLGLKYGYNAGAVQLNFSVSNFNNLQQQQAELTFVYYPFLFKSICATTSVATLHESTEWRTFFQQKISFKVLPKLFTELNVTVGDLKNASQSNGLLAYNVADNISLKAGVAFFVPLTKQLSISLRSDYLKRTSSYFYYLDPTITKTNTINYTNQSILLGLKWTF